MPNARNVTAPVLVIGTVRSGSTWMVETLGRHGQVQGLIENRLLEGMYHEMFESFWAPNLAWVCDDAERRRRAVTAVRLALGELFPSERPVWAMKLISRGRPWAFVHEVFPEARYIHLTRSPTTGLPSMTEFVGEDYPAWQSLEVAEREFVDANREALAVRDSGRPYLHVRQEDIAADPRAVWEQVRAFCGLSEERMDRLEREVNPAASTQGVVRRGRAPLPWTRLAPEVIAVAREIGYLPKPEMGAAAEASLLAGLETQLEQMTAARAAADAACTALRAELDDLRVMMNGVVEPLGLLSGEAVGYLPEPVRRILAPILAARSAYLDRLTNPERPDTGAATPDVRPPVVAWCVALPCVRRSGTAEVQLERLDLCDDAGRSSRAFGLGEGVIVEATVRAHVAVDDLSVSFLVCDEAGVRLMGTTTFDERQPLPPLKPGGALAIRFRFENHLGPGTFAVSLAVTRVARRDYSDAVLFDQADGCLTFRVGFDPERPVHYRFHQPVTIKTRVTEG